ncbi:MAG: universal stress protein [Gemmatimonadales bacterium]|nr:MAG: universal stress protein [Gemmatimonadales bacterium]
MEVVAPVHLSFPAPEMPRKAVLRAGCRAFPCRPVHGMMDAFSRSCLPRHEARDARVRIDRPCPSRRIQMNRLLVPLDGSALAETALPVALGLARRFGAELHLASVVSDLPPVPLAAGDGELITRWFDAEEKRASEYLSKVVEGLSVGEAGGVETHVRSGPVARTLQAIADDLDVSMVVMTTHGRGAWQRAWLGSVADVMIRQVRRPVLLLRERDAGSLSATGSPKKVVVPLDGSAAAEVVLDALSAMVEPGITEVELVLVLQEPMPMATSYLPHAVAEGGLMEARKERAREYMETVRSRLADAGHRVESRIIPAGDAGHGILQHLERSGADMVALSTRGRGGAARLMLGSVADKVIRSSSVPVLVTRRAGEEE